MDGNSHNNSAASTGSPTTLQSPPQSSDRSRPLPPPARHSDRQISSPVSTRDRASTASENSGTVGRTQGRRTRRHLSEAGIMSTLAQQQQQEHYTSFQRSSSPQGLEGPPSPNGGRQTLQEFLSSLETVGRNGRQDRLLAGHRHSMSSMTSPDPAHTSSRTTGRHTDSASIGRRRSSPLMPSDPSLANYLYGGASPSIPNSPPPRYQRGDYQEERAREPHPGRRISMDNLASSFYLKPKWQPDMEVAECPICRRAFTFFYRKHHCRKCGRVVCANCSPHRITIPRQYIVEPPSEGSEGEQEETLRAETDDEGHDDTTIFGGEEVRLCNPCVPDPNPLPPPEYTSTATAQNILSTFPPQGFGDDSAGGPQSPLSPNRSRYPRRSQSQREWLNPYNSGGSSGGSPHELARQRSATDPHRMGPASPTGYRHPRSSHSLSQSHSHYASLDQVAGGMESLGLHSAVQRTTGHRHRPHASTNVLPTNGFQRSGSLSAVAPPTARVPPPRRIAEEDECPICHEELPAKGPDGSEDAREAHVSQCIESHLYPGALSASNTGSSEAATAAANDAVDVTNSPNTSNNDQFASSSAPSSSSAAFSQHPYAGASSSSSSSGAGPSSGTTMTGRPRAETHAAGTSASAAVNNLLRRANMLVYHASEKDCIDADGAQKECVICLEDFVVGAELGRLECWCVFHRTCIREWWDKKGLGACPTHQSGI